MNASDYTNMNEQQFLEFLGTAPKKWAEAFNISAVHLGYSEMAQGWLETWFSLMLPKSSTPHKRGDT